MSGRRHPHVDEPDRSPAPAASEPQAADGDSLRARQIVGLQRTLGNQAVTALVRGAPALARQPAPPDPRAVPARSFTLPQIEGMTLAAFNRLTREQADWASMAPFTGHVVRAVELRELAWLAQKDGGHVLDACAAFKVKDLRAILTTRVNDLVEYGRACADYGWEPAANVATALKTGVAAGKLAAVLPANVIRETIVEGPNGHAVTQLLRADAVDDFCTFVQQIDPLLSALNGDEVKSYLRLKSEANPLSYKGLIGPVRNPHHFTKAALDALKWNVAHPRAKPLAIVLHSAVDHNGAFHRDPHMSEVIVNPRNLTILIEGSATVAAARAQLDQVVAAYGQGTPPRAHQIMLAGHGESRVEELAGSRDASGALTTENVDLNSNQQEALKLIDDMIDQLDTSPSAQIVLNGCLTASAAPKPTLPRGASPADRLAARTQLAAAVAAKRSLADTIRDLAAPKGITAKQVSAANASFGDEASLIDVATGKLGLRSPGDPALTSTDKFAYVRRAGEATGAMRAVVETLLANKPQAEQAMRARLLTSQARTSWDDAIIKAMYREALADLEDVAFINLESRLSGGLSECQFVDTCRPFQIARVPGDVLNRVLPRLEGDATFTSTAPLRLVTYEVWGVNATRDDKKQRFLQVLGTQTAQFASTFIEFDVVKTQLASFLPDPPGTHAAGELRLALLDVVNGTPDPLSVAYLRRRRNGAQWASPTEIDAALGGLKNSSWVLDAIREPGGAAPPDPYNLDLDGDGKNDFFVTPMVADAIYPGSAIGKPADEDVFARPDATSTKLGTLHQDVRVDVIGRTGAWWAIQFGADRKPAFVQDLLPL